VVRIDPARRPLRLLSAAALGLPSNPTAEQWAERHGLLAVINAGMFEMDHRTPTGYAKVEGRVLNPHWKTKYQALLVADPKDPSLPQARILDPECDGDVRQVAEQYRVALQSIRMIDCHRQNRWSKQPRRWSIAALASDGQGRILLLHSRSPYPVHDFNAVLLQLPLDTSRAMYLEGGPEASLHAVTAEGPVRRMGSFETGFFESDANTRYWPLPNVLAVERPQARPERLSP
jgi:hypothetical protein